MDDTYQAYLLRLRRSNDAKPWRVSVQNVHTGEIVNFGSEREMLHYLLVELGSDLMVIETPHQAPIDPTPSAKLRSQGLH